MNVSEWYQYLTYREELEYDLPEDEEPFRASPVNRFRSDWYVLHLVHSFWRVTETTRSIHSGLKKPGAFGYSCALANLTPDLLQEV